MSLEQKIEALTAAVEANTAAQKLLHEAWNGLREQAKTLTEKGSTNPAAAGVPLADAPEVKTEYSAGDMASAAAQGFRDGEAAAKTEKQAKPGKVAPTPAATETAPKATAPAEAAAASPSDVCKLEDLQAAVTALARTNREFVVATLNKHGGKSASTVPEANRAACLAELQAGEVVEDLA